MEAAIVTPTLLVLLLGTLDLGIAVLRYNMLAEGACTGARSAIVHGSDAASELPTWTSGSAATAIHDELAPLFAAAGIQSSDFTVTVTYQQVGGADSTTPGNPVTVRIDHTWVPLMSFLFGSQPLTANSKMIIAN